MVNDQNTLHAFSCTPKLFLATACKTLCLGVQFDIVVSDFFVRTQIGDAMAAKLEEIYADVRMDKEVTAFTIPELIYFLALNPENRDPAESKRANYGRRAP